jgi:acetolactate synthase I/II/III large subunit
VADTIVGLLADAGVRRCYTVPGESFLALIDAIDNHPRMRLVSVRHESGASFMADADARITGVPAVAMASRGPGSANLAIGVHTAYQDSTPMIVLLGQVDSELRGREAFQEVDLTRFYQPITKWAVTAERAAEVPELVTEAWRIATSGRPGPVMIALPSDIVTEHLPAPAAPSVAHAPTGELAEVGSLAERLLTARRPVAIVGERARPARESLVRAAQRFGIGVCTAFRRQDSFPVEHPLFLGHLGLAVPEQTTRALADSDLVLVIGTRLDEVSTQRYQLPRPTTPVLHIGRYLPDGPHSIVADPADVLTALAAHPSADRTVDWTDVHAAVDAWSTPPAVSSNGAGVHPAQVISALRDALPPDAVVSNDAGNFSAFLHRYWRFPPTTTQLAPANGAMGYAVPAAVAASLAEPNRTCAAVVGDGGILMTGQEIETAVRLGAAVLVVAMQNGLYGTIAMHQARELGRTAGVEIGAVDLARWAESLGAAGYSVADGTDLPRVLRDALGAGRPAVVAVHTDPDVITPTSRLSGLLAGHQVRA